MNPHYCEMNYDLNEQKVQNDIKSVFSVTNYYFKIKLVYLHTVVQMYKAVDRLLIREPTTVFKSLPVLLLFLLFLSSLSAYRELEDKSLDT